KAITMKREMGSWGEENSRNCNAMFCWFSSMKSMVDSATSNRTMISTARLSHCMQHHPHPLSMPESIAQHRVLLYRAQAVSNDSLTRSRSSLPGLKCGTY